MKNLLKGTLLLLMITFSFSSCYTYKFEVGKGAQTGIVKSGPNHYFVYGLAPGSQTDYRELAGDATDYSVKIEHTFVDGLLNALTLGIYTPTTTTITK